MFDYESRIAITLDPALNKILKWFSQGEEGRTLFKIEL